MSTEKTVVINADPSEVPANQMGVEPGSSTGAWQIIVAEQSRHLDCLKTLRSRLRARRDFKGVQIVTKRIRAKKELMERLNLGNYGGDA